MMCNLAIFVTLPGRVMPFVFFTVTINKNLGELIKMHVMT